MNAISGVLSVNTTTAGGGPSSVGGTGADFSNSAITAPGTFTSSYFTPSNQTQLVFDLGSAAAAAGQINFAVPSDNSIQLWNLGFTGTFTGSATVTLHYDPTLTGGVPSQDLQIYHYTGGSWVAVANEVVDPVDGTITFTTVSFSPFVLGVAVPEPSSLVLAVLAGLAWLTYRKRIAAA